jgi:hypothetical protein
MRELVKELEVAIAEVQLLFKSFNEHQHIYKPTPDKWSKKEILGHLIDSAQNNIQRFVRGQYEQHPKIVYAQNEWVELQHYQCYSSEALIQLWVSLNMHICNVLSAMSSQNYTNTVDTGKGGVELHTLQFLADDYLRHLLHHVKQINR